MSRTVVDELESVEVQQQDCDKAAGSGQGSQGVGKSVTKESPIWQAGEGII